MTMDVNTLMVSTNRAAELIEVGPRHIRRLAFEGWFKPVSRGRYRLRDVIDGYRRSLKESQKDSPATASKIRMKEAQAAMIEQKTAREAEGLTAVIEFEAVTSEVLELFRSEMVGFGSSITNDPEIQKQIDTSVNRMFVRTYGLLGQRIKEFRSNK